MRIMGLTRYTKLGASSRLRMYQYEPAFRAAGMSIEWRPLFSDSYVRDLYQGGYRSFSGVTRSYCRRALALIEAARFDLVWLEKESLPWLPGICDPAILRMASPYVVDYDDAVFHSYDLSSSRYVRMLLGKKIDSVMRHASLVVAGNAYLAQRAWEAGACRVEIIPTVIDLQRYQMRDSREGKSVSVGWIGTPSTQIFIERLVPVLSSVLDPEADKLVTIGARFSKPLRSNHEVRAWSEATEVDEIRRLDIGVMPLVDRPFERGKCGYKLIQYMACGVPVVASPVGVNIEIVRDGVNGFLVEDDYAWARAIRELKASAELRARMGAAGRRLVEEKFCLQVTAPRLVGLQQNVYDKSRRARG